MSVHTFRLDTELENELENLVKTTGHKKSFFIKEAIKSYLEDRADYMRAVSILEKVERNELRTKSLNDILSESGVTNEL